ncbi:hypothetical protein VTK26DRAFT_2060 [Humicola hyalothermophila]
MGRVSGHNLYTRWIWTSIYHKMARYLGARTSLTMSGPFWTRLLPRTRASPCLGAHRWTRIDTNICSNKTRSPPTRPNHRHYATSSPSISATVSPSSRASSAASSRPSASSGRPPAPSPSWKATPRTAPPRCSRPSSRTSASCPACAPTSPSTWPSTRSPRAATASPP